MKKNYELMGKNDKLMREKKGILIGKIQISSKSTETIVPYQELFIG